jgi:hypothetical protein
LEFEGGVISALLEPTEFRKFRLERAPIIDVHERLTIGANVSAGNGRFRQIGISVSTPPKRRPNSFGATTGRALPSSPPSSSPTPSPSASATNEPDDQQQYQRADGGVDDRRNNARAKMDAELRKQPTTDERANYSNDEIADDPKPGALHDLSGQPSGTEADP